MSNATDTYTIFVFELLQLVLVLGAIAIISTLIKLAFDKYKELCYRQKGTDIEGNVK